MIAWMHDPWVSRTCNSMYTSGMLCKAIARAKLRPTRIPWIENKRRNEIILQAFQFPYIKWWYINISYRTTFIDPRNTATPSGKLCKLIPVTRYEKNCFMATKLEIWIVHKLIYRHVRGYQLMWWSHLGKLDGGVSSSGSFLTPCHHTPAVLSFWHDNKLNKMIMDEKIN